MPYKSNVKTPRYDAGIEFSDKEFNEIVVDKARGMSEDGDPPGGIDSAKVWHKMTDKLERWVKGKSYNIPPSPKDFSYEDLIEHLLSEINFGSGVREIQYFMEHDRKATWTDAELVKSWMKQIGIKRNRAKPLLVAFEAVKFSKDFNKAFAEAHRMEDANWERWKELAREKLLEKNFSIVAGKSNSKIGANMFSKKIADLSKVGNSWEPIGAVESVYAEAYPALISWLGGNPDKVTTKPSAGRGGMWVANADVVEMAAFGSQYDFGKFWEWMKENRVRAKKSFRSPGRDYRGYFIDGLKFVSPATKGSLPPIRFIIHKSDLSKADKMLSAFGQAKRPWEGMGDVKIPWKFNE